MTAISVNYHHEADAWWADSPDVEGFVAAGADLHEVRDLVREGLPFYLDDATVEIDERAPWESGIVVDVRLTSASSVAAYSNVGTFGMLVPRDVTDRTTTLFIDATDSKKYATAS